MSGNAASEQTWMTQHNLFAFPEATLSPLLVLVGGHRVSEQEDHPPGVIAHISDFHGDLSKPHDMRKAYSEIWKAKFSPASTHTFVPFFHLVHILLLLRSQNCFFLPFLECCHRDGTFSSDPRTSLSHQPLYTRPSLDSHWG